MSIIIHHRQTDKIVDIGIRPGLFNKAIIQVKYLVEEIATPSNTVVNTYRTKWKDLDVRNISEVCNVQNEIRKIINDFITKKD